MANLNQLIEAQAKLEPAEKTQKSIEILRARYPKVFDRELAGLNLASARNPLAILNFRLQKVISNTAAEIKNKFGNNPDLQLVEQRFLSLRGCDDVSGYFPQAVTDTEAFYREYARLVTENPAKPYDAEQMTNILGEFKERLTEAGIVDDGAPF